MNSTVQPVFQQGALIYFVVLCRHNWIPLGAIIYSGCTHTRYLSTAALSISFPFTHLDIEDMTSFLKNTKFFAALQILRWWFKALIETSLRDLLAYHLLIATFVLRICYVWLSEKMQCRCFSSCIYQGFTSSFIWWWKQAHIFCNKNLQKVLKMRIYSGCMILAWYSHLQILAYLFLQMQAFLLIFTTDIQAANIGLYWLCSFRQDQQTCVSLSLIPYTLKCILRTEVLGLNSIYICIC